MKTTILLILLFLNFTIQAGSGILFFNIGNDQPAYIGCWSGMRGSKLKITSTKIYDLGSKENSLYQEKPVKGKEPTGLQTGEKYLLATKSGFAKSFLAKWIEFSFLNDGTLGITTYETENDYLKNKIAGQGLFEKISCKNK